MEISISFETDLPVIYGDAILTFLKSRIGSWMPLATYKPPDHSRNVSWSWNTYLPGVVIDTAFDSVDFSQSAWANDEQVRVRLKLWYTVRANALE